MKLMVTAGALLLWAAALFQAGNVTPVQTPNPKSDASPQEAKSAAITRTAHRRKIPCKTPENASLCYWTHGRLAFYEGAVTFRIWKVGTRRMLGVFSGPSHYPVRTDEDMENPEFPAELDRALEADNLRLKRLTGTMWTFPPPVFADFEVCPLRSEEKGVRQPVCIESAKNIFVEDEDLTPARKR